MFGMKMSPVSKGKEGHAFGLPPAPQKRRARPAAAEPSAPEAQPCARAAAPAKVAKVREAIAAMRAEGATEPRLAPVAELRRLLSVDSTPPIQAVIEEGGCALLAAYLRDGSAAVQLEAAWAATNIASGATAQTLALLEAGAAASLFHVLTSERVRDRADLCDQCLSALANVAGDADARPRDKLLEGGVVGHLGSLFERIPGFSWDLNGRVQVLRSLTRLMSNLCCGQPAPPLEEVDCAFDYFVQVLLGTDDAQMLADALFGLCSLLDGAVAGADADAGARAARLLAAGMAPGTPAPTPHPVLVKVVDCARQGGASAALATRLLAALVAMPGERPTDAAISASALATLRGILQDGRAAPSMRCDAAWALSNIAAGTTAQAQRLLDATGTFKALCGALEQGRDAAVKHECAWAVVNLARRGSQALPQLDGRKLLATLASALKGESGVPLLCTLLDASDAALRLCEEQAAAKGLSPGATVAAHADAAGLSRELERLQHAKEAAVYRRAVGALEALSRGTADRENAPPPAGEQTPKKGGHTPSAICGGSPVRPAAYKFGA